MRSDTNRTAGNRCRILTVAVAVVVCLCGARATSQARQAPPVTSAETATEVGAPSAGTTARSPRPASTEDNYAAREASAKDLENFKGGDIVIVGTGGLIIVLLVILILVV